MSQCDSRKRRIFHDCYDERLVANHTGSWTGRRIAGKKRWATGSREWRFGSSVRSSVDYECTTLLEVSPPNLCLHYAWHSSRLLSSLRGHLEL